MKKLILNLACLIFVIAFTFSCKKEDAIPVSGLTSSQNISVNVGSVDTIKVIVKPWIATNIVEWKSSNTAIATIKPIGVTTNRIDGVSTAYAIVTGISHGKDTIIATSANGDKAMFNLTVNKLTIYRRDTVLFNAIAIDAQGNKWCAYSSPDYHSNYGVLKFDGTNWTSYSTSNSGLVNNQVSCITIDTQKNIWFGTRGGVSKFDGTSWTTYNSNNSGLAYNHVYAIASDTKGNIWFGTSFGVSKFDGSIWTTYNSFDNTVPNCIAVDPLNENIWVGTSGGGVYKFDGSNWTNVANFHDNTVYAIGIDEQDNKWYGTGLGLYKYYPFTEYLDYTTISAIAVDVQKNIWVCRLFLQTAMFDGTNWNYYKSIEGVNSMAIDLQGNKWFAGYGLTELQD